MRYDDTCPICPNKRSFRSEECKHGWGDLEKYKEDEHIRKIVRQELRILGLY